MFFIYGFRYEWEDSSWTGKCYCGNCGRETVHMFKLYKKYPTFFFIKMPWGWAVKRYLVCTECGANRLVKKKEYKEITESQVKQITE